MKVNWSSYIFPFTAMGVIATNVIRELDNLGIDVSCNMLNIEHLKLDDYPIEVQKAIIRGHNEDAINIFFAYPDIYNQSRSKINIGYTGADTDGWYSSNPGVPTPSDLCNSLMDYMLTPSNYSKNIMKRCGVTNQLEVFPHGIDFDVFKLTKRTLDKVFTFVYTGELSTRKGVLLLIKAFSDLFGNNPDFRLLLRANTHMYELDGPYVKEYCEKFNNMFCIWENKGQNSIYEYMKEGNCFVWSSFADWFGLPPMEALSCGSPVIATKTNGYYEFIGDKIIPVEYDLTDINGRHPYFNGKWNEAKYDSLCIAMKEVVNNYEKHSQKAYESALWLRENFSWKTVTEKYLLPFLEDIDKKHFKKENKNMKKRVLIGIPHKDRLVEISVLLDSLKYQTFTDFDILIIDDSFSDCLSNKTFQSLCTVLRYLGHDIRILKGQQKGPHVSGSMILESSEGYELIFRLDDDISLQYDTIQKLVEVFDKYPNTGAVGPIYLDGYFSIESQWIDKNWSREFIEDLCRVRWINNNELFLIGEAQLKQHYDKTPINTQHLNSGFMYKREVGIKLGGYFVDLSPAGHREESIFSFNMFRNGYKLFIAPEAIAWHFHPASGGIRETNGQPHPKSYWDSDEKKFLELMEQWLPKNKQVEEDLFTSVIILTYGDHKKLRDLLNDISLYTNHPSEFIIVNNDVSQESVKDFTEIIPKEFEKLNIKYIQLPSEYSVSEARNIGTKYMSDDSKFICFIDDDARILGRYNQNTDWLDYLYNCFHEVPNCGAVSPIYTYFEELQCHCVSVACMFTSKKIWNCVGGFDHVFGNKEKGTFGYEDTDWSYRCESMGFKLTGVNGVDFPFYHHNTENDHTNSWYTEAIKKSYKILLDKYDVEIE